MNSFVLFALRTREGVRLSCDTHRDAHLVFCVGGSGVDRIKGSPGELAPALRTTLAPEGWKVGEVEVSVF